MALAVGEEKQKAFLAKLGLLEQLEIELPERSSPLVPSKWGKIASMTVSYGHGIAVTPMHIVTATAALINGGILNSATMLKKSKFDFLNTGVRVVKASTSDSIRRIMRLVVTDGTGGKSNAEGYLVGGKTGTADKLKDGKYDTKVNISSFVGAFPMHEPKYVVFVVVDGAVGNKRTGGYTTGGMIAAPIAGEVIKRIAPMLGIMPVDMNDYNITKEFEYENEESKQPEPEPTRTTEEH